MAKLRPKKQSTVSRIAGKARAGMRKVVSAVSRKPGRRTVKQPVTRPMHDHD